MFGVLFTNVSDLASDDMQLIWLSATPFEYSRKGAKHAKRGKIIMGRLVQLSALLGVLGGFAKVCFNRLDSDNPLSVRPRTISSHIATGYAL